MFNCFFSLSSYVSEKTINSQLFLRTQLVRHREHSVQFFFRLSLHVAENTVNAQLFLRVQLVRRRKHNHCSVVSSGSARTSQKTQSMLSCFFGLSSHMAENTINAQLFLRAHLVCHKVRGNLVPWLPRCKSFTLRVLYCKSLEDLYF